jgi:hypothetical protein
MGQQCAPLLVVGVGEAGHQRRLDCAAVDTTSAVASSATAATTRVHAA